MPVLSANNSRITINLTSAEAERLEKYYSTTGQPTTDVIRDLIRSLTVEEVLN
ncbi:MAG: CopG family transcriptional regulator [Nostoc sp.]